MTASRAKAVAVEAETETETIAEVGASTRTRGLLTRVARALDCNSTVLTHGMLNVACTADCGTCPNVLNVLQIAVHALMYCRLSHSRSYTFSYPRFLQSPRGWRHGIRLARTAPHGLREIRRFITRWHAPRDGPRSLVLCRDVAREAGQRHS